jgi:short-subunit dehydrogenase
MPPGTIEVLPADLSAKDDLARVADRARDVDLLVNNAGFGTSGRFADADPDRVQREIELNVMAVVALARAALVGMVARDRGWICNVSSVAGFQPAPNLAVYAATKAFVTSFTEGLHEELRGTGVSATALCPGLTRTEFQAVSNPTGRTRTTPEFAWMTADEVAVSGLADTAAGRAVSVPGLPNKALVTATSILPRSLVRRLASIVQSR